MQQQITDIASLVFWLNVRNKTFSTTRNLVLKKQFAELWNKGTVLNYLDKLNLEIDQRNIEGTIEWIYEKVNDFIYNSILNEQNIEGTIYLDDTVECKTPDFNDFQMLENLKSIYSGYDKGEINKLPKIGTLLLRTPLPSIVFTSGEQIPNNFIIKDTVKALGFQANIIFETNNIMSFPANDYGVTHCVSEIFKIQNFNNSDTYWHKILPNSIYYRNLIIGKSHLGLSRNTNISNPKFVTNANIKRALFKVDKSEFDFEGEIYKHSFNYFNLLEKRDLLSIKCLYEFPEMYFDEYYSKINTSDQLKFVFEEQQPAFHSTREYPKLLSDFENYLIPEQIKKDKLEIEYRNWFKQNIRLTERKILTDLFKDIHFKKWDCLPIFVDYENSGAFEFANLNIDEIENAIDDLLKSAKDFIDQSTVNKNIISIFGKRSYNFNNLHKLNTEVLPYEKETIAKVLKAFELEFKRPIISILKEYYRVKYNPNLEFEENILIGLGFRQCKSCQEMNTIINENKIKSIGDDVKSLILELQDKATNLDNLELNLLERLDNNEIEAHNILENGLESAEKIYFKIGHRLNDLGGYQLMQYALNQVSNKYSAHTVINYSWGNIGDWQN